MGSPWQPDDPDPHGECKQEIEQLRDVTETAKSWLDRWAEHVGDCETGDRCTCGLTAVRHGLALSLQPKS